MTLKSRSRMINTQECIQLWDQRLLRLHGRTAVLFLSLSSLIWDTKVCIPSDTSSGRPIDICPGLDSYWQRICGSSGKWNFLCTWPTHLPETIGNVITHGSIEGCGIRNGYDFTGRSYNGYPYLWQGRGQQLWRSQTLALPVKMKLIT